MDPATHTAQIEPGEMRMPRLYRPGHRRLGSVVCVFLLIPVLALLAPASTISAATIAIADGDTSGLVNAIAAANGGGTTTISLAVGGTYTFAAANNATTTGANALPVVAAGATIVVNGNGATVQRSTAQGTPAFRFFTVNSGGVLQLTNLTLQRGLATGATSGSAGNGGAILNNGTATVTNCDIAANGAFGANGADGIGGANGQPGGGASGGAIANTGSLTLVGSTFATNNVTGGTGGTGNAGSAGGTTSGGAIANSGTVTILNSTFSVNNAYGGDGGVGNGNAPGGTGGNASGGAIAANAGSATITNATISGGNSRAGDGGIGSPDGGVGNGSAGALSHVAGSLTIQTTIIDRNFAGNSQTSGYNNCGGLTASNDGGHNIEYIPPIQPPVVPNCGFSAASSDLFTDPMIAPSLAANGGPTPTLALLAGSAAINAGGSACPIGVTIDQRGQPRPQGGACDIGAFEYVAPANPSLNAMSGPASGGPVTFTGTHLQMGTVITVAGVNAPVISVASNGTSLVANVPVHAPGVVSAVATNPGNLNSLAANFTYIANLTATSISPPAGPMAGGMTVTIKGSGFSAPTTVTIGGNPCTNLSIPDSSTLTCITPAGSGTVNVIVGVAGQMATLTGAFTYGTPNPLPPPMPSASPTTGTLPLPIARPVSNGPAAQATPNPLPARRP